MRAIIKYSCWLLLSITLSSVTLISCIKNDPDPTPVPPRPASDSSKNITSFIFKAEKNPGVASDVNGNIVADSIYVIVPYGTNVTNLLPTIITTGVSVSPASLMGQDFSQPVQYTVTAQDGTTKKYKVLVSAEPIPATLFINTTSLHDSIGNVHAIDANTGKLLWKYAPPNGFFMATPAFANGVLFVANRERIIALDTATKNIRWEFTAGSDIQSAFTVVNGILYANCNDGYLYALNEFTGDLKWKFAQQMVSLSHGNASGPTVVDGVVYFGSSVDQYIYAVDAVTGNLKWKTFNSYGNGHGTFIGGPSVVNGTLYIGDVSRNLLALNTNDGSIKWVFFALGGGLFQSSPTVENGVVYIGAADGNLYAVNAADGTLKWLQGFHPQVHASPIVSQGTVFIGNTGGSESKAFYALDANDGTQKWHYIFGTTDLTSSPVVFNGMVYMSSYNRLLALDVVTGKPKWEYDTGNVREHILAGPCIVDQKGHIYYSAVSGSKD